MIENDQELEEKLKQLLKDILKNAEKEISFYENLPYVLKKPFYNIEDGEPKYSNKCIDYEELTNDIIKNISDYSSYEQAIITMEKRIKQ